MSHGKVIFNITGQVLEWYPPMSELLRGGAPSAASTYAVFAGVDSNDDTPRFQGTATLDPVSLTVASASGYSQSNRNRLNLTPTGVAVGRKYLLSNSTSQRELVRVKALGSNYADVEDSLAYDYALNDTLVGLRQVLTVPASFVQDEGNINVFGSLRHGALLPNMDADTNGPPFRLVYTYSISSLTKTDWATFDVVRKAAKANLSIEQLNGIVPDVLLYEWSQTRGTKFVAQLDAAERDVEIDTRLAGYDPDAIIDPELWERIVLQRWAVVIGKGMLFTQRETPVWLPVVEADYSALFQKAIGTTCRVWIDTGTTGAISPVVATQMWLKPR